MAERHRRGKAGARPEQGGHTRTRDRLRRARSRDARHRAFELTPVPHEGDGDHTRTVPTGTVPGARWSPIVPGPRR